MVLTTSRHRSCPSIVTDRCRFGIKRQNGHRRLTTSRAASRLRGRRGTRNQHDCKAKIYEPLEAHGRRSRGNLFSTYLLAQALRTLLRRGYYRHRRFNCLPRYFVARGLVAIVRWLPITGSIVRSSSPWKIIDKNYSYK